MQCPSCGLDDVRAREAVVLTKFTAGEDSWEVEGKAKVVQCIHGHCANCGTIFDVARREIPVQYPSLPCPQCAFKWFRYRVRSLEQTNGSFAFVAHVECRTCGFTRNLRRILSKVGGIRRLTIGLTGVEVERGDGKA